MSVATMKMTAALVDGSRWSGVYWQHFMKDNPKTSWTKDCSRLQGLSRGKSFDDSFPLKSSNNTRLNSSTMPLLGGGCISKKRGLCVVFPDISSPSVKVENLDSCDDEYDGVIVNSESLPSSANAFASALMASLSNWKLQGKKGVWLKIPSNQADLVPIAIQAASLDQEGFDYHHAEAGYVMLTHWIPDEPCLLPASPSHQIGVAGFVINDKREVLVVKEKCPCSCSGVWKMPTGYINKSEDIFSGAIREVKEETGVNTIFMEMVAFRHAHLVAFEKSDLLFVCMLKPLSFEITLDEKELQAAKWMPLHEFLGQPFYEEDHMSKKVIDICIASYEDHYKGFIAHQLTSKLDGRLSYLYYDGSH